jgi:hypothetical protein
MIDLQRKARPSRVTVLAELSLFFAIWNAVRLGEDIFFWKTLLEYGTHPLYIAFSGGVWLVASLLLTWGLWSGKKAAWLAAMIIAPSYASWYWIDRLFLQRPHANWLFSLIATSVILFILFSILLSPRTRRFFHRDSHE